MFTKQQLALGLLGWSQSALALPKAGATPSSSSSGSLSSVSLSGPSVVSHPASEPHTPYSGTPTTTGALRASSVLSSSVPSLGVAPGATDYPSDGKLHAPQPAPYTPGGGVGTNGTTPVYNAKSDFDFESLALATYQEYIELDLFHDGLARFSVKDFEDAGLTAEDRYLIEYMADQEVGHATMLTNILGAAAPKECVYNYPYTTVNEFLDFSQKLTRFGESGVYGFLGHLDSREAATLLTQSITTEARQQMIFRQFEGLFPMPVWFEVGIPQSWAWTLIAPYISSCPKDQTRLAWQNFPALSILNQPNPTLINGGDEDARDTTISSGMNTLRQKVLPSDPKSCTQNQEIGESCAPGITRNRTAPLSWPGREVHLTWETPGKAVGPNNSYTTTSQAGEPKWVLWASQLNVTYSPLEITAPHAGKTLQPDVSTYQGDPAINGTMFIAVTDEDLFITPFNFTAINPHVVAGPALYQSG